MLYPWLKAVHLAAAIIFASGVLAVAMLLAAMLADTASTALLARAVRRWDQVVTGPALFIALACGLVLAVNGHWFDAAWLHVKLVFVMVLASIHGYQAGLLRRLVGGAALRRRRSMPLVLICTTAIAVLAVVKP
ncbi:putative membrane protein [Chitinivorax tropicus]|uniref:Protoporphyrinogen IX oxidase n=2 Tax=Chitinivorax tropicus TaxID=714531 RepID=A0A840MRB1_9PROT|nr:putative membrane protein [Chitinivorax tropicus]